MQPVDAETDEAEENDEAEETEETPVLLNPRSLTEGDYALVKLFSGHSNKYYVGKILSDIDEDNDFQISYLHYDKKSGGFRKPQVPDLKSVNISEIMEVLPKPSQEDGKTKRQQATLVFKFDFQKYSPLG